MILYLLLVILAGLMCFFAIIALIIGLVKKRSKLVKGAAIFLTIGIIGGAISTFYYAKKTIEYVNNAHFQNMVRAGANYTGQTAGSVASGLSEGFSNTLDEDAIAKLAHKSANITGASIKAIAKSVDSTFSDKQLFLNENLKDAGLSLGHATVESEEEHNKLDIFIDFKKDFNGKLVLTNYDQKGNIIERVEKEIKESAGSGEVISFNFLHSDLGMTTYFILSKI